jgi:hypothetical protein
LWYSSDARQILLEELVYLEGYSKGRQSNFKGIPLMSQNIYIANDFDVRDENLKFYGSEVGVILKKSILPGSLFRIFNKTLSLINLTLEQNNSSQICRIYEGFYILYFFFIVVLFLGDTLEIESSIISFIDIPNIPFIIIKKTSF